MTSTEKTDTQRDADANFIQTLTPVLQMIGECPSLEALKLVEAKVEDFINNIAGVDPRFRELAIRNLYHTIGVVRGRWETVEKLQRRIDEQQQRRDGEQMELTL